MAILVLLFSSMLFVLHIDQVEANQNSSIPNPNTLVYVTDHQFSTLDPFSWGDPMIISCCYDTLVSYDRGRVDRFRPLLATEVPSLENERITADGLTYRFTIRSDSPLTAEDVEYSFERAMVYNSWIILYPLLGVVSIVERFLNGSEWDWTPAVDFEDIDNAVETEGNDVVFHLAKIYPPFMHHIVSSRSSIVNKAWCIEHGDWPGTEEAWLNYYDSYYYDESPLHSETPGYGPFMVESFIDNKIVLVRNEDYWRGPARLERVEIRNINDWNARKQMFLEEGRSWEFEGTADVCSVPEENYSELEGVEGIRVHLGLPVLLYSALDFNYAIANNSPYICSGELDGNGIPPDFFGDIDIRKAFAYSIDYDTFINEVYAGEALHPASPVIDGLQFHNPNQEGYIYDLDKARHHFQQAWDGEVWAKGFNLTLVSLDLEDEPMWGWSDVHPLWRRLVEILKDTIEAINPKFHVTMKYTELSTEFLDELYANDIMTSFISFSTEELPDSHNFVAQFMYNYGNESWNSLPQFFQGYKDSTVDSLIEAGMLTIDPAERQTIYYELQRIYHEDVPSIPLVQLLTRHYQRDWVWGWYYKPVVGMDFYEMLKGTCQDATRNIIRHVSDLVDSGALLADVGDSLLFKLGSAIYLMDMGDMSGALQQMSDFIGQVNASEIPVCNGDELLALAQEIIEAFPEISLNTLMARALSPSILVLGGGLFIATIILLMDRRKMKNLKKFIKTEEAEVRVSIAYIFLSRLRESKWNLFKRKKESE